MAAIQLKIDQLLLDTENPRIGTAKNQHDALQKVLDDQGEKLYTLAESIASDGMSPIDRLLVVREKAGSHRFISLEGNRRVAALKILSNPTVLTGLSVMPSLQRRLEEVASSFHRSDVEPIDCFETDSREKGSAWILLRHTGENEGRGVVGWSGHAAARFRGTDPALQALEFVISHGNLTESQRHAIDNSFPITTLDRLLSTPDVRKRIGVDIKDRKLYSALPAAELLKPLRKIVLDLAEKAVRVGQLMKKDQQVEYVDSFSKADRSDLSKRNSVRAVEGIRGSDFSTKPAPAKRRSGTDPSSRKVVVARAAKLLVSDNKTAEILKELRRLRVEDFPHSVAVLLRVFLELSVDHYLDKNGISPQAVDKKSGRKYDKSLSENQDQRGCCPPRHAWGSGEEGSHECRSLSR